MKIALVTPARPGANNGNRRTALRWAAFLRAAGHRVALSTEWEGRPADLLLALHARRSHDSVRAFAHAHPDRPIVLALTGTDVYRDIHESEPARESLRLAHRFITLQAMAAHELPRALRGKVHVVVQSSATRLRHRPAPGPFTACVVGHLRMEKDPMRAAAALRHLPAALPVRVLHLGAGLDPALAGAARAAALADPRYRWLGARPHSRALECMARSHVLVVSSRMEGGANVVSEALRIGLPVIASRVSGNVGLLGRDYPGYYTVEKERELARLLRRAATDRQFYARLQAHVRRLRPMVSPRAEAMALRAAVRAAVPA